MKGFKILSTEPVVTYILRKESRGFVYRRSGEDSRAYCGFEKTPALAEKAVVKSAKEKCEKIKFFKCAAPQLKFAFSY